MKNVSNYFLTFLRMAVGWHLMYEGVAKIMKHDWTSKIFLEESRWLFAGMFHQMASSPDVMKIIDFMNIWGLILIGLSLIFGLLVRWSSVFGAILMLFYFIAHPSIPGYTFGAITEGNYLWVNKTLIEFFILITFTVIPTEMFYGLDRLIKKFKDKKNETPNVSVKTEFTSLKRRELLKDMISIPVIGAFAYAFYKKRKWDSFEEKLLTLHDTPNVRTGATQKFRVATIKELKGLISTVNIDNLKVSRVVMDGSLIDGYVPTRDLLYVSKLVKAYYTDERVMKTLQLAEKCGINTILIKPHLVHVIKKYRHETAGKIQFISDCDNNIGGFINAVKMSHIAGADAMYLNGGSVDTLAAAGKFKEIKEGVELIRSYGKPAGIGANRIESVKACVEYGIHPDFWVKTLHHHNYPSAHINQEKLDTVNEEFNYNMFCFKPNETIEYMDNLNEPWIAFKVLAAGAISPKDGFRYAFENGADLICVGMFDFQIVEDANIAFDIINDSRIKSRRRRWIK